MENLTAAAAALEPTAIANANPTVEKRAREEPDVASGPVRPVKMVRAVRELKPSPYFYYRDHSMEVDNDPLSPLTPPGRVPNFPAKMHAILSRQDFADIVAWLPHGRAWRVLKPREFEIKVIPLFFEHSKYSSFVRQANGWGFRRITQGKDRNSYYHENFLRGLPHLCKTMKRPGINEKKQANPEHEPDFYKISEEHPVPEKADDDSILLHCTMQGGPKARMPIYWGSAMSAATSAPTFPTMMDAKMAPKDQMTMQSFQQAMAASEKQVVHHHQPPAPAVAAPAQVSPSAPPKPMVTMPNFMVMPTPAATTAAPTSSPGNQFAALAAANQMAFQMPAFPAMDPQAASQFAAGFAAATAFTQQHFSSMFSSMAAQHQQTMQAQQQQQAQPAEAAQK